MIIQNAIKTPDGTVLRSFNRHDCKTHLDKNGFEYSVDGGNDYIKRSYDPNAPAWEELCVSFEDVPLKEAVDIMAWGTRGKCGTKPLKWVALSDMDHDHIEAVLENCDYIPAHYKLAFEYLLDR